MPRTQNYGQALDATQQTAALEYEYPGWFIVWTENKIAEDVYAWGRRVTALDLEIDGPTAARTAPWRLYERLPFAKVFREFRLRQDGLQLYIRACCSL
ncbi:hypothetical protein, partial [Burkholderia gladioli]